MGSLNIKTSRSRHQNNFLNFSLKPPLERNKGTNDELQPTFSHSKCTRGKRLKEPPPPALKPGPVQEKPHGASFFRPTCRSNLVVYRVFCDPSVSFRFCGIREMLTCGARIASPSNGRISLSCVVSSIKHNGRDFRGGLRTAAVCVYGIRP